MATIGSIVLGVNDLQRVLSFWTEALAEIERLLSLGAQRVDWDLSPEDPDFTVLADPEGNRFCVIDTSRGE
jgi:catechol 2,3-dioxygenase-like lactoylglutathione lyase family enzyme